MKKKTGSKVVKKQLASEALAKNASFRGRDVERIKTGITGFDDLIKGGIPRGALVLVTGPCGSGKSVFSLQYLVNGAQKFDEAGTYITFEEAPESIRKTGRIFGWNVDELERKNKLRITFKEPYEIKDFAKTMSGELYYALRDCGAKRAVIDSVSYLSSALNSPLEVRKTLAELGKHLKSMGVTAFLVSESADEQPGASGLGPEEFIVDGVVALHNFLIRDVRQRAIEIIKMRHTQHDRILHPFEISGSGLEVYSKEQVFKE
jgi:circadian clock protein KaiC